MILVSLLIMIFFMIPSVESVVADQIRFARYLELENKNISGFVLSTSQETSQRKCAQTCKHSVGCESFFYNAMTGECELREALFITPNNTIDQQDLMYHYIIKGETDWCPSWKGFQLAKEQGPCLKFSTVLKTWYDANDTCVSDTLTSRMLVVDSQAKRDQVIAFATANSLSGTYFIGLVEDEQDSYKWVDGSNVGYSDWHTADYSDPSIQDCVHMLGWRWVRNNCSLIRRFVCEMIPDTNQYMKMMNIM